MSAEDGEATVVVRRRKTVGGGIPTNKAPSRGRRISCLDLGTGDYEGWLYTQKPNKSKHWDKCRKWCVLKRNELYVYGSKMDSQASLRISLSMFRISDANKETKKRAAFKIYHSGTCFYFRCDKEDDKFAWMNHLSLASIGYNLSEYYNATSPQPSRANPQESGLASSDRHTYSDEEDEDESELSDCGPLPTLRKSRRLAESKIQSHINTNEELRKVVSSIRDADLDLVGESSEQKISTLRRISMAKYQGKDLRESTQRFLLSAKEQHLKMLQQELLDITSLLDNTSSMGIHLLVERYEHLTQGTNYCPNKPLKDISSPHQDLNCNNSNSNRYSVVYPASSDESELVLVTQPPASQTSAKYERRSQSPAVFHGGKHKQLVTHM